jgi:hypothetical protein
MIVMMMITSLVLSVNNCWSKPKLKPISCDGNFDGMRRIQVKGSKRPTSVANSSDDQSIVGTTCGLWVKPWKIMRFWNARQLDRVVSASLEEAHQESSGLLD